MAKPNQPTPCDDDDPRPCHRGDQKVLDTLRAHGDHLEIPRPVSHWLYFSSEATARKAAELLAEEGYATEVQPSTQEGKWLTLASHRMRPSAPAIEAVRLDMESLVESLGGEYDGWETEMVISRM